MSKDEIEKRIRTLFYLLFGVIFTFLFILTSTYLDLTNKASLNFKNQSIAFIEDAIKSRERFLFEDFSSRSYNSIDMRFSSFLTSKNISEYNLVIFANDYCEWGQKQICNTFKEIKGPLDLKQIITFERLDRIFMLIPVHGWGETDGMLGLEIPISQIISHQSFFEKLTLHVLPFLVLIILTMGIYSYTEKNLIKPTIKRIIDSEKLQIQKDLVRQFAHDIRSPITVLEELIDMSPMISSDVQTLAEEALGRIKGISNDLLEREKSLNKLSNIQSLFLALIKNKEIEFKSKSPKFEFLFNGTDEHFEVSPNDLYRAASNIINNSIESVNNKTPIITITVSNTVSGLIVHIRDNGDGIKQEDLPLIELGVFSSKDKGNGLGIKGVKDWIHTLKGEFKISSELGAGTNVSISLPS